MLQLAIAHGHTNNQTGEGPDGALLDDNSDRDNLINPSFMDASGVMTVQQKNGSNNAIQSAISVVANF